jgi:hypothetical protein
MAEAKEKSSAKEPPVAQRRDEAQGATKAASEADSSEVQTEEVVLTVNRQTGEITKIQRVLDSGARQDFSEEEYVRFFSTDLASESGLADEDGQAAVEAYHAHGYHEGYVQGLVDYELTLMQSAEPFEAAYQQGMADYEATLVAQGGLETGSSPEELAYYQGMADYESALTAQAGEASPEDIAYHQGLADAEAAYASAEGQ